MSIKKKFKRLTNLCRDPEDIRLLKTLAQLMSKTEYRDIDVAIKNLYLLNRNYIPGRVKNNYVVIDHTACERLRDLTAGIDQEFPPYRTIARLHEIDKLINRLQ